MDKSTKLYKKAMEKYQNGYINEAIEACEKSISTNIKNAAAINLKGLLLYLKGELDNARNIWKLNKDINKDSVSKKYIESSYKDEEKLQLYETALTLIKDIRINEALALLEICSESHFNSINVGNAITDCLIKQGEYNKAVEQINKVLDLNKKDQYALEHKRMLMQYGIIERKINYRKIALAFIVILLLSMAAYISMNNKEKIIGKVKELILSGEEKNKEEQSNKSDPIEGMRDIKEDKVLKVETETQVKVAFPAEEIKALLEKRDYEELYKQYISWKDKVQEINEKSLIGSLEEILKNEGTKYFYTLGNQYIKGQEDYKAIDSLSKARNLGKGKELYPHIIFVLGSAYERVSDYEKALKLYDEYHQNYLSGDYGDEVLNRMAMIYKNVDRSKAKTYAEELIRIYPNSIYNNSKIRAIINEN